MSLQHELDEVRTGFADRKPDHAALFDATIAKTRRGSSADAALKVGDAVPHFTLLDIHEHPVTPSDRVRGGPVVLFFYRGSWCPLCNLKLGAHQRKLGGDEALADRVLAVSPPGPDATLSTAASSNASHTMLSDAGKAVARSLGVTHHVAPDVRAVMKVMCKALPPINGDERLILPLAATHLIGPDRTTVLADLETDDRRRMEPNGVLAKVCPLRAGTQAAT